MNDTLPELAETVTCRLISADNGAHISSDNSVNITILPSDKPNGVIGIDPASRTLYVGEPALPQYSGQFTIR